MRLNFGFWIVTQLRTVMTTDKKPLIMGSYITQLAINLNVLNILDTNMHVACNVEPIDMDCLYRMGLVVLQEDGCYVFAPPGPAMPVKKRASTRARATAPRASSSRQLTQATLSAETEERLQQLERKINRLKQLTIAVWRHIGPPPPFPPTP